MLLTHEDMHFDFGAAKLDPRRDKDILVWAVQQFLYGEITGIQIGHWLYNAPDLEAARFLARQAVEEFQHVGNFLRILEILGAKPDKAAGPVRFLATGLMGNDWAEHVAMEMALGEGLVLQAFYAMIETVDEPEVVAILKHELRLIETLRYAPYFLTVNAIVRFARGQDILCQFGQFLFVGQASEPRGSHKDVRVVTINKIFQKEVDLDA